MFLVLQYKPGLRTLFGDPSLACFIVLAQVNQTRIFIAILFKVYLVAVCPLLHFLLAAKKLALISVQCQIPISSTINPCFQNPAPAPVSKWKNQARREPSKPGHWLYLMCGIQKSFYFSTFVSHSHSSTRPL